MSENEQTNTVISEIDSLFTLDNLQGTWKKKFIDNSVEISQDAMVVIKDSTYKSVVEGVTRLSLKIRMIQNCNDHSLVPASKHLLLYQDSEGSKKGCYEIISVNDNKIVFDINQNGENDYPLMILKRVE